MEGRGGGRREGVKTYDTRGEGESVSHWKMQRGGGEATQQGGKKGMEQYNWSYMDF